MRSAPREQVASTRAEPLGTPVARFVLLTTPGTVHACTLGSPWSVGGGIDLSAGRGRAQVRSEVAATATSPAPRRDRSSRAFASPRRGARSERRLRPAATAPRPLRTWAAPSVEPAPRRRGVNSRRSREYPRRFARCRRRVQQDVRECVPDLAGRPQDVEVVTVGEHAPTPSKDTIHGASEASADRLHPRGQLFLARSLHDRVNVIRLDHVVRDAEPSSLARGAQASLELPDESRVAKRGQPAPRPESRDTETSMRGAAV